MELEDIKAIVALMKENDLSVFELERDGVKLKLKKGVDLTTAPAPLPAGTGPGIAGGAAAGGQASLGAGAVAEKPAPSASLKDVVSPMVGTFYRSPSPEAGPFVDVGSSVNEETVVCIIEAMKVMNEIKAEVSGTIAEVVAESGKPVQFGQVLFRVK